MSQDLSKRIRLKRSRILLRFAARMALGLVIGIMVVTFYFAVDYAAQDDKRLYFIDHRDSLITVLIMGSLIGAAIGLAWAFTRNDPPKEDHLS